MKTRILLADDHTLVRQGLKQFLLQNPDFEVVAEAATGTEAVELAEREKPDVAIVDIGMKELNGIDATSQMVRRNPQTAVLILSMHSDERYVSRAIKAGARGYVLKNAAGEELVEAILAVQRGRMFFSPEISRLFQDGSALRRGAGQIDDRYELLTDRERHIYQLLAEGNSNKDVANLLELSLHTVETHRWRIMEKLGLHSPAELVLSAVRRGIVT
jgi:two-component system, NarL family, response regulator NreC